MREINQNGQALLIAVAIFAISPAIATGRVVVVEDHAFATANWNSFLLFDSQSGGSAAGFQDVAVGVPSPSLAGELVSGPSIVGQQNLSLVHHYLPSELNPIQVTMNEFVESISVAFDFMLLPNAVFPEAEIEVRAVVAQEGKYYFAPLPFTANGLDITAQGWVPVQITNMHQSDFTEIHPSSGVVAGSHPNLLSPFSMGVGVNRSTQFRQFRSEWRLDNLIAQVNIVPEPSSLTALGAGFVAIYLAIAFKRRRSSSAIKFLARRASPKCG